MLRKRFLLLFIAAAVGIGLLWIEDYTSSTTLDNNDSVSLLPDYYGEGLRNRSFDSSGNFERQFIALRSVHYPAQKLTEFSQPKVKTVNDDGEIWIIQSLTGIHYEEDQRLVLREDVQLAPINDPKLDNSEESIIIRTSELTLLNQSKIAKTDKPVEVISINGRIDAVGMIIKMDQQRVEFLSQVKAKYAP
jgi:LPS export ABC transporter protein LptC